MWRTDLTVVDSFIFIVYTVAYSLLAILSILIAVAYFTLLDRKVMAAIQRRRGPNVVGFWGLLQPLADGLKLLVKEAIIPNNANSFLFILAPLLAFTLSLSNWALIPYTVSGSLVDVEVGILFIFVISSFGVYGIILAGWSSNSKYAILRSSTSLSSNDFVWSILRFYFNLSVVMCGFYKFVSNCPSSAYLFLLTLLVLMTSISFIFLFSACGNQ